MEKIAIVGGGLVGAMQAIYMAEKGFEVDVYERRGDIRNALFVAGKSINLALSDRGWEALRKINMEKEIREISIPMRGRKIHNSDGSLNFQAYGIDNQSIWSVSRGGLNQRLLIKADTFANCNLFFKYKCIDLDLDSNTLLFENGNELIKKSYDRILATDGAFSAIRLKLEETESITSSIATLEHGYKELLIPSKPDGQHQIDPNSLHIWPRGGFMLIALANLDGSFTVTLFMPFEGKISFEKLQSDEEILAFFKREFPDALELMPDFINDFKSNPTASLVTVKSYPWNYLNKILLMGDAAHAIVPFYGQGMNCGFEDCSVLDDLMNEFGNDWSKIAPAYTQSRKINGDAIADLALNNYIEMRDLTAQPEFLLRKEIEVLFTKNHPDKWLPLYSQVTFSHIPYSKAIENAKIQDEIMNDVMKLSNIEEKWDSKEVEEFIIQKLQMINA